ncbi:MAG: PQ-loop repeat-containing protein [Francisellaceae bacterium]|nr:PQ-loop repeat-containing protein [Francisellaceae bacterium]MBT6208103.1 PQ-loop repeat-containing protein [Francisellaceae bacterium]MBT6538982.1 PQ-loop repeat-containing protein [Francisellaceae bacterium]
MIKIIGFLAAFTSTISLLPQIIKSHQTRSVNDLSYWMLVIFLITSVLWVVYGLLANSAAVFWANILMVIFSIWMITIKYYYAKT